MFKNFLRLTLILSLSSNLVFADWIDSLASSVSQNHVWNKEFSEILNKPIEKEQQKISEIQNRIGTLNDDLWSKVKRAAFYVELNTAKSQKKYYEKVKEVLSDLHENKNSRERLVKNLIALQVNNNELEILNKNLADASETGDKIKINFQIAAKKAEIGSRKAFIRGLIIV